MESEDQAKRWTFNDRHALLDHTADCDCARDREGMTGWTMRWLRCAMVGIEVVVSMLARVTRRRSSDSNRKIGAGAEQSRTDIFVSFPIPDRGVPWEAVDRSINSCSDLESRLAKGSRIGVHCRACIGRASIAAASLLIRSGISPEEAWLQGCVGAGMQCSRYCLSSGSGLIVM